MKSTPFEGPRFILARRKVERKDSALRSPAAHILYLFFVAPIESGFAFTHPTPREKNCIATNRHLVQVTLPSTFPRKLESA